MFLVTCWSPSLEESTKASKKAATWKRVTAIISKDPARSPSLAPSSLKRPPVSCDGPPTRPPLSNNSNRCN